MDASLTVNCIQPPYRARRLLGLGLFFVTIGAVLVLYASMIPIFTDAGAPNRISDELGKAEQDIYTHWQPGSVDNERFDSLNREWHARMRAYETPHKMLFDLGVGLLALGAGLVGSFRFIGRYYRETEAQRAAALIRIWFWLWAIKIPASFLFYLSKGLRNDYPPWADSIAIAIFGEWVFTVVGWGSTRMILRRLLRRRMLVAPLQFNHRPESVLAWARAIFISMWIGWLALSVITGVPEGDFGLVFPCVIASVLLCLVLVAPEVSNEAGGQFKPAEVDTPDGV